MSCTFHLKLLEYLSRHYNILCKFFRRIKIWAQNIDWKWSKIRKGLEIENRNWFSWEFYFKNDFSNCSKSAVVKTFLMSIITIHNIHIFKILSLFNIGISTSKMQHFIISNINLFSLHFFYSIKMVKLTFNVQSKKILIKHFKLNITEI